MYKTISINNNTYQQLHVLATKLKRPKSQIIHDLINDYIERIDQEEKDTLKSFNASVKRLTKRIKLPRGTKLTSEYSQLDVSGLLIKTEVDNLKIDKKKNIATYHGK